MAELKVKKISNKEKIDAVCQYTGNNCSVQQAPNAYVDPCYDDCKKTSEHNSYWKSRYLSLIHI